MGFFSSLTDAFGFSGNSAGGDAAAAQNAFLGQGADELRRQFEETSGNLNPFIQAGQGALPGLIEGTTAGGLDERLARIFNTDTFGSLVDERTRAAQGQLAAGGLTRSGTGVQGIADISSDLGLQLEQLLTGRLGGLANSGLNAATNLGNFGAQNAQALAGNFGQQGRNVGSGIITDAQSQAAGTQNFLDSATTAASIFFSDPALKENVREIGVIADLTLVEWDWKPETRGTMIDGCGTMGFMADEVKEKHPEHVYEYGGFMVIDYPALLNDLEA